MLSRTLLVSAVCLAALLTCLLLERIFLGRCRKKVRLRVAVTGTRGKSSVTRLIAAALRDSGRRVLARTTGSQPVLIHPDGSEHRIPRTGPPTLLEGRRLLHEARRLGADTVVAELMSIDPEYLETESRRLLQPSLLAVTNVRLDHQDVMGRSRAEIACSLARAIPARGRVFMLDEEAAPAFHGRALRLGSRLVTVPRLKGRGMAWYGKRTKPWDIQDNVRLALAVAKACGADEARALRAMAGARPDLGAFRIWSLRLGSPARVWRCASGFAANEPESTRVLIDKLRALGLMKSVPRLALLNLREDRPDRSRQWLSARAAGFFRDFDGLLLSGASPAVSRLWRRADPRTGPPLSLVHDRRPEALLERLAGTYDRGGLLFGMGNIGGLGLELVGHWDKVGVEHA